MGHENLGLVNPGWPKKLIKQKKIAHGRLTVITAAKLLPRKKKWRDIRVVIVEPKVAEIGCVIDIGTDTQYHLVPH